MVDTYLDAVLNHVHNSKSASLCSEYMKDVIGYYGKNPTFKEREELVDLIKESLEFLNDTKLDNQLMVNVVGELVNILNNNNIFH